jgi:phospholipid/cholesterol/gamma-HCH transport system ATP-binding protein
VTAAALSLHDVTVEIGGRTLVRDASARFSPGSLHAVVGRSGAGKSVLMKAALGLLPMQAGRVELVGPETLDAHAGDALAFERLRSHAAFVHQDPSLLEELSVVENVAFALLRRRGRRGAAAVVEGWLERLGLASLRDVPARQLSPGALRRVALARALCLEPEVLVVDEPTTGLDPLAARDVDEALLDLAGRGATLIVITHDVRMLDALAPTLCWVHEGRVAWQDTWSAQQQSAPTGLAALLGGGPS